jgi:hypothetical protein
MKKKIKNIFFEFGRKNTVKWVFFISQLWSLLDRLKVVTFKPSLILGELFICTIAAQACIGLNLGAIKGNNPGL